MKKDSTQKQNGFTLIEIMTAVSIFLVVMTVSMGSIVGVLDADRKARSLRIVMGNLNLAMETMAREMRFGTVYHCGTQGSLATPQNCSGGSSFIGFLTSDGVQTVYRRSGTAIQKSINGGSSYTAVTAPDISIDDLTFYVLGAVTTDTIQPKVLIRVRGTAGEGISQTDFTLQTLVSQRILDREL